MKKYDPEIHRRRSIRLKGYDYTQAGMYFVTLGAYQRENLFGEVAVGVMQLNACGEIATRCWKDLPQHFPHTELIAFAVMPNHFHGLLALVRPESPPDRIENEPGTGPRSFVPAGTASGSLAAIIQNFKSVSTRKINQLRATPGAPVWQRNYYEHVLRNERDFQRCTEYIESNPARWQTNR